MRVQKEVIGKCMHETELISSFLDDIGEGQNRNTIIKIALKV